MRLSVFRSLLLVVAASGCTHYEPPPPLIGPAEVYASRDNRPSAASPAAGKSGGASEAPVDVPRLLGDFTNARAAAAKAPADPGSAQTLLRTGASVIQARCDLYFRGIGTGARNAGLPTRQIGLISTTLALASAGRDALAGVAIGSGLATGTLGNVSDAFFFPPDVQSIKDLVDKAFARARSELLGRGAQVRTYEEAIDGLRLIQDVCTTHRIRSLVNEAVARGQVVPRYDDGQPGPEQAALDEAKREAGAVAGGVILNDTDLLLFGLVQGNTADPDFAALFCRQVPAGTRAAHCEGEALKSGADVAARVERLRTIFATLDRARPDMLTEGLAKIVAQTPPAGPPGEMGMIDSGPAPPVRVTLPGSRENRRVFTLGIE